MGRLTTLTILLTLGSWGAATDGAPPDDAAAPTRPAPPAPPGEYVKAGVKLYGSGQYDMAAKYLKAANDYMAKDNAFFRKKLRDGGRMESGAVRERRPATHRLS